jgi:hypothetical protein
MALVIVEPHGSGLGGVRPKKSLWFSGILSTNSGSKWFDTLQGYGRHVRAVKRKRLTGVAVQSRKGGMQFHSLKGSRQLLELPVSMPTIELL